MTQWKDRGKEAPKIKVKVIARDGRDCLVLRWRARDGRWKEEVSEIPVGDSARSRKTNRGLAERLAAEREDKLNAEPPDAESLAHYRGEYRTHMEACGHSKKHIDQACQHVKRICEECRWVGLAHLDPKQLEKWFVKLKKPTEDRPKGYSNRTVNLYLESIKAFCEWLVCDDDCPLAINPFAKMQRLNQQVDRRRIRRPLTPEEFTLLVQKTHKDGKVIEHVDGPTRAVVYIVASWTGLRANELASLQLKNFQLDAEPPVLTVEAGDSKRRRRDTIVLHPVVVARLKEWIASQPSVSLHQPLFPLRQPCGQLRRLAEMIRADLEAIKVTYCEGNRYCDFHSHRHAFITNLARAGVGLAQAQRLARHSDPRLTADIYTHLQLADEAASLAKLPPPPTFTEEQTPKKRPRGDKTG